MATRSFARSVPPSERPTRELPAVRDDELLRSWGDRARDYGATPVHELADADTLPMEVDPLPSAFEDEPTVAYEPQPGPPQVRDVVRVMSKDGKRAQSIGEVRRVRGHEAHVRNFGWVELRRLQVIHRKEG